MRKVTLADRLRYRFDNLMARGPIAVIAWLGILSAILILLVAIIDVLTGITPESNPGEPMDFFEVAWRSLLRTLDAGTMGGDTGTPAFLFSMLVVTLGGVFTVSILIGVITSGIERRLDLLRRGRSFVVENDHVIILGWSAQVPAIISELVIANTERRRPSIVILADRDTVEMEESVRAAIGTTRNTRIIYRSGNPLAPGDLEIVNLDAARAIIIPGPLTDSHDMEVIKTMLAILNAPQRRPEPYHVVAQIRNSQNMEAARMVGRAEAQLILVSDLISRITVQTCRQSGLSVVYTELLNFEGDEIYFHAEPSLAGKTFGEALAAFGKAVLIGIQTPDMCTRLNPPMETKIGAGDRLIVIAQDQSSTRLAPAGAFNAQAIVSSDGAAPGPEHLLVLGWNGRGPTMLRELDHYVAPGSSVTVVADSTAVAAPFAYDTESMSPPHVTFSEGDTANRRLLDRLELARYQHIIVLSYSDKLDGEEADARTLMTLLHLRDIRERTGARFTVVSEMLELHNRRLAEITQADDFIVSGHLASLMMAQVAENKYLAPVFADLFDPEGSEVYLKPVEEYVRVGQPLSFYTVLEAARRRGEVAIGYRLQRNATQSGASYGVVINPAKAAEVTCAEGDKVVVLAES